MYLFIDTETAGLPTDVNSTPRLVQIAWILFDIMGRKVSKRDFIVKPDGFEIPESASRIHGINTNFAIISGKSLKKVLTELMVAINSSTYLVAHNLAFDERVLTAEFKRCGINNPFALKTKICTMESTTNFCGINTSKGYKWPSLSELYEKVFSSKLNGTHNAVLDIEATAKCFWYLKRNKIIKFHEHPPSYQIKILPNVKSESNLINNNKMNRKEQAINLKGFLESLKLCDQVSQKQLETLFEKIEDLIISLAAENDDSDYEPTSYTKPIETTASKGNSNSASLADDLPF